MMKRNFNLDPILFLILTLAVFFRFYNFFNFQYWSGDEEVLVATIRHIVWDRSPSLIVQNANLGFGLGPYYHFILSPFFWLVSFKLTWLFAIPSVLGVLTTYLVYLGVKEFGSRKQAYIAAFLYACSFFIATFDRRLHHLMPNSLLAAFTFLILAQALNKKFKNLWLLSLPIGFSFHSDPSIAVLVIAIAVSIVLLKIKLQKFQIIKSLIVLLVFSAPFFIAEVRYKGAVSKPVLNSITRPIRGEPVASTQFSYFTPLEFIEIYSRTMFIKSDKFFEQHFCYCRYPAPIFSPYAQIVAFAIFISSFVLIYRNKRRNKAQSLIFIMLASFVFGIFVFNVIYRGVFHQHYFFVILPIFAILTSEFIYFIFKKSKITAYILLVIFLAINSLALVRSELKYPLVKKLSLVNSVISQTADADFSLYSSRDPYIEGGGWTELFTISGKPASKSYWYEYWGWIYQSYSLFPRAISGGDPEKIVWVVKEGETTEIGKPLSGQFKYSDIEMRIYENKTK